MVKRNSAEYDGSLQKGSSAVYQESNHRTSKKKHQQEPPNHSLERSPIESLDVLLLSEIILFIAPTNIGLWL